MLNTNFPSRFHVQARHTNFQLNTDANVPWVAMETVMLFSSKNDDKLELLNANKACLRL